MDNINFEFKYQKCSLSETGFCRYYSINDRANCYLCPIYQLQNTIKDNNLSNFTFSMEDIRNASKSKK